MDLETSVRVGDFQIVRRLGAGGMGVVYLANQVPLNRLVALKVIGPALDSKASKAWIQREAQAVARLHHPGIAEVYFVGQDQQVCYMAMEYVDGIPLRDVMNRLAATTDPGMSIETVLGDSGANAGRAEEARFDEPTATCTPVATPDPAPPVEGLTEAAKQLIASPDYVRRCCEIVRDAAVALGHAHGRGVVHRDIKPGNIMVDREGKVRLIDFGLARFFEDMTLTNTGALVGTPMYMSPEQVTGRIKLDHRTDVYSLGLTLYELLILRRPITAPTREGVLRSIVTKALFPASKFNRAIPRGLEAVIHKATAKDPDERYQAASELADDLQCFLDGRPVSAIPYRYKLDEREIQAERPAVIVSISLAFFLPAFFLALILSSYLAELLTAPGLVYVTYKNYNAFAIICFSVLSMGLYWVARGLYVGNETARTTAIVIVSCVQIIFALMIIGLYKFRFGYLTTWQFELCFTQVAAIVFVYGLMRPSVVGWFRLCKQFRDSQTQRDR